MQRTPGTSDHFGNFTGIPGYSPHSANPILPGYYADPSIVQDGEKIYIYATLDPWGGETLGCWESTDFKNWTYRVLNWPTKKACTSTTSRRDNVWAPSVVKGPEGKFHMAISVSNEVWMGVANHPLGPWSNVLGDQPLIPANYYPEYHMIDAELFVDDDGQVYLYWGSGWNWTNGRCFVVNLKPDLATFEGEVRDVTPANYFEAPFMVKRHGRYFLMYSSGITMKDTYQVHYAVGDSPFGPFTEPDNSPILVTDQDTNISSPGHHAVFHRDGRDYILYHRHSIPFDPEFIGRQVCVDEIHFDANGLIQKVTPTHEGPALVQGRSDGRINIAKGAAATASSQRTTFNSAERVLDDNYATRWAAAKDARGAWLQLDLGVSKEIKSQELRFEYAWKPYHFTVESSKDGTQWEKLADFKAEPAIGSPVIIESQTTLRFIRIVFGEEVSGVDISVIEWALF